MHMVSHERRKCVLLQALIGTRAESQPGSPGPDNSNSGARHSQLGGSKRTCKFCQTENITLEPQDLRTEARKQIKLKESKKTADSL